MSASLGLEPGPPTLLHACPAPLPPPMTMPGGSGPPSTHLVGGALVNLCSIVPAQFESSSFFFSSGKIIVCDTLRTSNPDWQPKDGSRASTKKMSLHPAQA